MSIDKELKSYKARVKESQTVLSGLEERVRQIAEMQETVRAAQVQSEDVKSELAQVQSDKARVKDELSEAAILQDPAVDELRADYVELTGREQVLQGELDRLSTAIDENTPNPDEVASLKAALRTFKGPNGSELIKAVQDLVEKDDKTLRERTQTAVTLLPDVENLTYLSALADADKSYSDLYSTWSRHLEDERDLGRGEDAAKRLAYKMERVLQR
jgi:hypothetical protein